MDNEEQIHNEAQKDTQNTQSQFTWRPQDADRELYKIQKRNRVRNATVPENAIFKPAKPTPTINDEGEKRVAVYARVSTKSKEQVSSIENQTKYYSEKVAKTPNWKLQNIYKDEGISGTSIKRRKDFQKMIKDASEKKMDLILCASVSRFARDVSDCIEQVRKLKTTNPTHPVGVYFETEDIYTLDPNVSERLEMHAMFSAWESRNKSRRMILSYDQRICTGQYPVLDLLGYRHTYEGDLIIEPEEAKTVRFIYLGYIFGYSFKKIAEILTTKKRTTLKGRTEWNASMVKSIMTNERRWGDLDARKTICVDYKDRKIIKNKDIRDAAYIPNHHEPIVSPSIAKAAISLSKSGKSVQSVPYTSVIMEGNLKGFISISPAWNGIDDHSLELLSRNVYTEEEYEKIEDIALISSGIKESNVESMTFATYEVPYGVYFMNMNTPSITITNKRIKFNKSAHTRLSNCEYIELLYHPILKMIAIRQTTQDSPYAIKWITNNGAPLSSINSAPFSKSIYERTKWKQNFSFKFRGVTRIRGNKNILFFYFDEPQILVDKETQEKLKESQNDNVQYVEYKEIKDKAEENLSPQEMQKKWRETYFGLGFPIRKKRDTIINSLNENDINNQGIIVENPLLGSIPSKEEISQELNELLASM